jgi:hypothetical protein
MNNPAVDFVLRGDSLEEPCRKRLQALRVRCAGCQPVALNDGAARQTRELDPNVFPRDLAAPIQQRSGSLLIRHGDGGYTFPSSR